MDFLPPDINGLPLHPLVVHAAVVLIPLTGLLALFMVLVPRFSYRFGPLVVVLGWLAAGSAWLGKETGEILRQKVEEVSSAHVEAGDLLPVFAGVQAVLVTLLWLADRRGGRGVLGIMVALFTLLVVVAAGYWTYRTGETGAQNVWG
ncbi:MAG TPA: hypothetical protein PL146_13345 [Mycobacterium sp.]|nr:hypothetical protein [Mycobacterium sp.]